MSAHAFACCVGTEAPEVLAGGMRKKKSARRSSKSHGKDDAESAASVGGEWMVSEFEAVDPELYFKYDSNAVDRAAAAVARVVGPIGDT